MSFHLGPEVSFRLGPEVIGLPDMGPEMSKHGMTSRVRGGYRGLKCLWNSILLLDGKMNWRDVVAHWLTEKGVILGGELKIVDLAELMIDRDMIPAWLVGNDTLHTVLLTQVMWETLKGVLVPRAQQGSNFTYHLNAKEMMNQDMARKSGLQFLALEKETGVNLDSYYKLGIRNASSTVPAGSTDVEPVVSEAVSFRDCLARDMKQLRENIRQIYD
jgi:hypothetical protein